MTCNQVNLVVSLGRQSISATAHDNDYDVNEMPPVTVSADSVIATNRGDDTIVHILDETPTSVPERAQLHKCPRMTYDEFCLLLTKVESDDITVDMWRFLLSVLGDDRDGCDHTSSSTNTGYRRSSKTALGNSYIGSADLPKRYQTFISCLEEKFFSVNVMWKDVILKDDAFVDIDLIREYMEEYLMLRLHSVAFKSTENKVEDDILLQRIKLFATIMPRHLQLDILNDVSDVNKVFQNAIVVFNNISAAISTSQKLSCIQRSIDTVIEDLNQYLRQDSLVRNDPVALGADEILPLFILIVIKSQNASLFSNFKFIDEFMNPSQRRSRSGFILTMLESAITYILNIHETSLTGMNAKEFRRRFSVTLLDRNFIVPCSNSAPSSIFDNNSGHIQKNPYDLIVAYDEYCKAGDSKGIEYIHSLWSLVAVSRLNSEVVKCLRYILAPISSVNQVDSKILGELRKKIFRLMCFFTNENIFNESNSAMKCPVLQMERMGPVLCVLVSADYPKYSNTSDRSLKQISKDLQDLYLYKLNTYFTHNGYGVNKGAIHTSLNGSDFDNVTSESSFRIRGKSYDIETASSHSYNTVQDFRNDISATYKNFERLVDIPEEETSSFRKCMEHPYQYPVLFLRESQGGLKTRCFEVYFQFTMQFQLTSSNLIILNSCLSSDSFLLERAATSLLPQNSEDDSMFQSIIRRKASITSLKPRESSHPYGTIDPILCPKFFNLVMNLLHKANIYLIRTQVSSRPILPVTYNFHTHLKKSPDDPHLLLLDDENDLFGFFMLGLLYELYQLVVNLLTKVMVIYRYFYSYIFESHMSFITNCYFNFYASVIV